MADGERLPYLPRAPFPRTTAVPKDSLTITDNRTGQRYEVPIQDGTIRAMDLRQIKASADDLGLISYDPAYMNTASCRSAVSYIDGDQGILRYRGYPIEQLAEQSTFLETAYLLLHGELPSASELDGWVYNITHHTILHENIKKFIDGFHHDAHPMGMFVSAVAALSTFYPAAKHIADETSRRDQIFRLIAKTPTLAAFAHRHSVGMPYAYPDNDLSYTGNFLNMMFKATEVKYQPNAVLARPHHQARRRRGVRRHGQESAPPDRRGAGAHRPAGRLLHLAQVVPERGLLFRDHLPSDALPGGNVPGALRHRPHAGLARSMAGDAARQGTEDRATAAGVYRVAAARLRLHREENLT